MFYMAIFKQKNIDEAQEESSFEQSTPKEENQFYPSPLTRKRPPKLGL
jgi:hypothetical protein